MTTTRILRKFFKKFFNIDAEGSSVTSILENVVENNDDIGGGSGESSGGGSGGSSGFYIVNFEFDTNTNTINADKSFEEILPHFFNNNEIVYGKYGNATMFVDKGGWPTTIDQIEFINFTCVMPVWDDTSSMILSNVDVVTLVYHRNGTIDIKNRSID